MSYIDWCTKRSGLQATGSKITTSENGTQSGDARPAIARSVTSRYSQDVLQNKSVVCSGSLSTRSTVLRLHGCENMALQH